MLAFAPLPVIAQEGGGIATFLPLILIVVIFYLLLIRPQQKRARQQRELVGSLETNDRVVTIGGLYGTITAVDDDTISLEVAPGTTITMAKQAISRRLVDDEDES
jgi:preprotein translocase subunit YajC